MLSKTSYAIRRSLPLRDRVATSAIVEFDLLNLNLTEIARNKDTDQLVQFSQDESGRPQLLDDKGIKLANLSQVSAQMPLETTAIGTITLQPAATAQLKLRGISDPIKINKIAQGDFAQQNLNLEADIEIRLEKPTYPALTLDGKSLGRLDKDSVATLTHASALTPGASFDGTVTTIGSGRGKQAQITTARGTILKTAQQYSAYNRHHFNGDSHRFTVQFVAENKTVPAIYLDNRKLGLVIDKESRSTLLKAGINQNRQIIKGAKIESNIRAAKLIVDPVRINYPPLGAWVKRYDPETSTLRAAETTPQQAFRHQLQGKDNIFLNPSKPMNTSKANPTNDKIEIYTDGSCLGNPGPGGWAAIINKAGAS